RDGKPFKTRDGGVARLTDLLDEAVQRAAERIDESGYGEGLDAAGRLALARQVGIGAVKFADLSGDRLSGYVFDADRLVAFEGRTGPYLQYACVRLRSLLDKAGSQSPGVIEPKEDSERDLVLACLDFASAVADAGRQLQPGILAEYAFGVAQRFSRFYANCAVLGEPDATLRASRLGLCVLTRAVLERSLDLLGIDVPQKM
ncbi:MAG TPA: arginine--tRNA ligase, partial [Luteibacter sp.]|nr:arginine--tRNA ligase [Luteibacter sp.]